MEAGAARFRCFVAGRCTSSVRAVSKVYTQTKANVKAKDLFNRATVKCTKQRRVQRLVMKGSW